MKTINVQNTVGEIVTQNPSLSRIFEEAGIDYCCGGKKPLDQACKEKQLDPAVILTKLNEAKDDNGQTPAPVDVNAMTLSELADHIEQTHHAYLRTELPRLDALTHKVASVHGERDARLGELRTTFIQIARELSAHMLKEEQVLFPLIRSLEAGEQGPSFRGMSIVYPIRQMELEHDDAGTGLERQRELTDGYLAPDWACNTYRAMLDALASFERDMHLHIHKENNVLFPRAIELESQKKN